MKLTQIHTIGKICFALAVLFAPLRWCRSSRCLQLAELANREAILPSGEPLISNGPENKFEFRYNTSPCRNFPKLSDLSPVRPPPHGAMRRAFKLYYFQNEKRKENAKRGTIPVCLSCTLSGNIWLNECKVKYILYCRKSTDEKDKQVLSIEAQIAELQEFATREKLEIVSSTLWPPK